jgi:hypothetical protein
MATLATTLPASQPAKTFAGNLPDLDFIGIDPAEGMELKLQFSNDGNATLVLLEELIYPDENEQATVKIRDVVESALLHKLPNTDVFKQINAFRYLTLIIDGTVTYTWHVVKGGLFIPEDQFTTFDYTTFFITNSLSWMPAERSVKYREQNYFNYLNLYTGGVQLYGKGYWLDGAGATQNQEYLLYTLSVYGLFTMDISFNKLITLSESSNSFFAFDMYVKYNGSRITNIHRALLINDFDEYDDLFTFNNSLGGYESIRFTGLLSEKEAHESKAYLMHNKHLIEHETTPQRIMRKFTGYFDTEAQRKWLREFFTASFRHHIRYADAAFIPERIVVLSQNAESSRYNPNSFEFEFKYANQTAWQYHTRETLVAVNPGEAVSTANIGDLPEGEFNEDFFNLTPLNQITDETLGT